MEYDRLVSKGSYLSYGLSGYAMYFEQMQVRHQVRQNTKHYAAEQK